MKLKNYKSFFFFFDRIMPRLRTEVENKVQADAENQYRRITIRVSMSNKNLFLRRNVVWNLRGKKKDRKLWENQMEQRHHSPTPLRTEDTLPSPNFWVCVLYCVAIAIRYFNLIPCVATFYIHSAKRNYTSYMLELIKLIP